jgi:Glycosyl transferase family 2
MIGIDLFSSSYFMNKLNIICLTPVKNEAWILDRFIKCTSLWADYIIIADQHSTDQSRQIALRYDRVILVENKSSTFNEPERQKLLIAEARKLPEPRLLITLDADEILTANCLNSPEWNTLLQAHTGTVIRFQRAELLPDLTSYWMPNEEFAWGFMDDGSEHFGKKIHSPRLPIPTQVPTISLRDIKVLHYQYTNWERMQSKHRWYQCWERLNYSQKSAIDIYRRYHHMDSLVKEQIYSLPKEWLAGYEQQGIDMTSIYQEPQFWWDQQVLELLDKHGTKIFSREAIWDVDWSALAQKFNGKQLSCYRDPRNFLDKLIHRWLKKTQTQPSKLSTRFCDRFLKLLKW